MGCPEPIKKPSIMSFFSSNSSSSAMEDDKLTKDAHEEHDCDEEGENNEYSDYRLKSENIIDDTKADPLKESKSVSFFRTHYEGNSKKEVEKDKIVNISKKPLKSEILSDSQICDNSMKVQSMHENFSDDDLKELIPSIKDFDSELLEFLPKNIQIRAKQRLKQLSDEQSDNKSHNIRDLLIQQDVNREPSDIYEEDLVECDQCKKKISAFTLPEHLDWHLAVSLSRPTKISQSDPGKRKRDSEGGLNKFDSSKKPCKRGIENYFRKS